MDMDTLVMQIKALAGRQMRSHLIVYACIYIYVYIMHICMYIHILNPIFYDIRAQ